MNATKTQTTTEALTAWLTANGFRSEGTRGMYGTPCYRKSLVRVEIEDEGYFAIYVFDARHPKAEILDWDAKFTNAPLAIVTAAITTALDTVRAAMLPED